MGFKFQKNRAINAAFRQLKPLCWGKLLSHPEIGHFWYPDFSSQRNSRDIHKHNLYTKFNENRSNIVTIIICKSNIFLGLRNFWHKYRFRISFYINSILLQTNSKQSTIKKFGSISLVERGAKNLHCKKLILTFWDCAKLDFKHFILVLWQTLWLSSYIHAVKYLHMDKF